MDLSAITPDHVVIWQWGFISLNATILFTWIVMGLLTFVSWIVTQSLSTDVRIPRWQNGLEVIVVGIRDQIREVSHQDPHRYLPFIGTLFLFIAMSNLLAIIPGYYAPTGSLSTTTALSLCVLIAVPIFGITQQGFHSYLRHYLEPSIFMLPFHVVGELSRTLALAIRLFGNVMSGSTIIAILLLITPLFFPIILHALELLIGLIQAYIFAILAMVYIAAATRAHVDRDVRQSTEEQKGESQHG
jgi:F-type H+-transporting ATPase subunit a